MKYIRKNAFKEPFDPCPQNSDVQSNLIPTYVTYLSVFSVILEPEPSPALVANPVLDAVLRARSGRDVTGG